MFDPSCLRRFFFFTSPAFSRLIIAASTVFLSIQHSSAISRRDGKQTPFLSLCFTRQQYTIKSRGFNLKLNMRLATIKKLPFLDCGTIIRHQLPYTKYREINYGRHQTKYTVLSMLRNLSLYLLGQLNAVCKPNYKIFFKKYGDLCFHKSPHLAQQFFQPL